MNQTLTRSSYLSYIRSLEAYNAWQERHPADLTIEVRFSALDSLYRLLPESSRQRPVDTTGIHALHKALSYLKQDYESA